MNNSKWCHVLVYYTNNVITNMVKIPIAIDDINSNVTKIKIEFNVEMTLYNENKISILTLLLNDDMFENLKISMNYSK